MIGLNDTMGDPGAFIAMAGAALDNLAEGVIERHPIGRTLMETFHATAIVELLRPQYGAWIGRPP